MYGFLYSEIPVLTLLHSEWPKLHRVLAILNAIGLNTECVDELTQTWEDSDLHVFHAPVCLRGMGALHVVLPF